MFKLPKFNAICAAMEYHEFEKDIMAHLLAGIDKHNKTDLLAVLAVLGLDDATHHSKDWVAITSTAVFEFFPMDDLELWCGGLEDGAQLVSERSEWSVPITCAGFLCGAFIVHANNSIAGRASYNKQTAFKEQMYYHFACRASADVLMRTLPSLSRSFSIDRFFTAACKVVFNNPTTITADELLAFAVRTQRRGCFTEILSHTAAMRALAGDGAMAMRVLLYVGDNTTDVAKWWLSNAFDAINALDADRGVSTLLDMLEIVGQSRFSSVWCTESTLSCVCSMLCPDARSILYESLCTNGGAWTHAFDDDRDRSWAEAVKAATLALCTLPVKNAVG